MAFEDEVIRGGSIPTFTLELKQLEGAPAVSVNVLRASDLGHADNQNRWWKPVIASLGNIERRADFDKLAPVQNEMAIPLRNEDRQLGALAAQSRDFIGLRGEVRIRYVDRTGMELTRQVAGGLAELRGGDPLAVELRLLPVLSDRIGQLQRVITDIRFPNAHDSAFGQGSNILAGTASATNGVVKCHLIDTGLYRWEVAQGRIKGVTSAVRDRGGNRVVLSGGQYTVGYAQDGDGDDYTYLQLTNGLVDFQDGDQIYVSFNGLDDVGDGSGAVILNPVDQLQAILTSFGQIKTTDIDPITWDAWRTRADSAGLAASGVSSIIVPWDNGSIIDPISLFTEVGASFGVAFFITGEGLIGVADPDVSNPSSDPDTLPGLDAAYHLVNDDIQTAKRPWEYFNRAECRYGVTQSSQSGYAGSYSALDDASIEYNNGEEVSTEVQMRFVRTAAASQSVARGILLRGASKARRVTWRLPDLQGILREPGERVALTHPQPGVDGFSWIRREAVVEKVSLDHGGLTSELELVTVGDTFGPVRFSGEAVLALTPELDTYVLTEARGNSNGSSPDLKHGNSMETPDGKNDAIERLAMRFWMKDPANGLPPGATILEATLEVWVNNAGNDRPGGWAQPDTRQLNSTTWGNNSTFDNFDDNGTGAIWDDFVHVGQFLGQFGDLRGGGWRVCQLNSAFVSYANGMIGVDDRVQFTFQFGNDPKEFCVLSSREGSYPPILRLTYRY